MSEKSDAIKYLVGNALFGIFFILSIMVLLWQAYTWMRYGVWPAMDCITAMSYLMPNNNWLFFPSEWIGAHKLLSNIHVSFASIAAGFLAFGAANA